MTKDKFGNHARLMERLRNASKRPGDEPLFGMEIEQFLIDDKTGLTLPYAGENGVEGILHDLRPLFKETTYSEGHLIGLARDDLAITIEPAAQLEFSIAPMSDVGRIMQIWEGMMEELRPVLTKRGVLLAAYGYQPKSRIEELALIPKKRYDLMHRHFKSLNGLGPNMMKGTASVHLAVDYYSEDHMGRIYRAMYRLLPVLAFMTENTPVFEGDPYDGHLLRMKIWQETDPARVDVSPYLAPDGRMTFERYLDFADHAPVIVKKTPKGEVYSTETLGDLMAGEAFDDEGLTHLMSMLFPYIRLKSFLEIRVADSMPYREVRAYLLLMKGLLENLDRTERHLTRWLGEEPFDLAHCVDVIRKDGLGAVLYGRPLKDLITEYVDLAAGQLDEPDVSYLLAYRPGLCQTGHLAESRPDTSKPNPVSTTAELNDFSCAAIEAAFEEHALSGRKMAEALKTNGITAGGGPVRGIYVPKIFSTRAVENFRQISETIASIGRKAIGRFKSDPAFRRLFEFDPRLEELILADTLIGDRIPMLRADIFYNEKTGDYQICELNTDGSSGMIENLELSRQFRKTPLACAFRQYGTLKPFELFDSLVEKWLALFHKTAIDRPEPTFAVVDFLDKASSLDEFDLYRSRFEEKGVHCVVADIRDLTFDGDFLCLKDGTPIHAVYRRAVTSDIMAGWDEVRPFVEAFRQKKVCLLGGFGTQVVHDKAFLTAIRDPMCADFLTDEECRLIADHLPVTALLDDEALSFYEPDRDKDRWVLKPRSAYGSRGVYIGRDMTEEKWREALCSQVGADYLLQAYVEPWQSRHVDFGAEDPQCGLYYNMTGLYVYDGTFAGVYSRISQNKVISTGRGGYDAASIMFR